MVIWTARILIIVAFGTFCYDTFADNRRDELYIGEVSEKLVRVTACGTKEAADTLLQAAKDAGRPGYVNVLMTFASLEICHSGVTRVHIDEVYEWWTDQEGIKLTLVRMRLKKDDLTSPPVFAVLAGVDVKEAKEKCAGCIKI